MGIDARIESNTRSDILNGVRAAVRRASFDLNATLESTALMSRSGDDSFGVA